MIALAERARGGDRRALARVLSVIETGGPEASAVLSTLHPHTGHAYAIGITGAPGSGKSTLTDRLVARIRRDGAEVGVLAIDPSSPFSGGAILGDRVRMQDHASDDGVFIRSMASRGHLGGLARATPHAIRALDAAGMAWVIVETVGVGQVEVEIAEQADTTIVILNPGWGDAVQAAKAGLLEIADCFVVNKADRPGADETRRDLEAMLELGAETQWRPVIVETVATEGRGVDELWEAICAHRSFLESEGRLAARRRERERDEVRAIVESRARAEAALRCDGPAFEEVMGRVLDRELTPDAAADTLLAE
jgi:LAO/AO transport system kinase